MIHSLGILNIGFSVFASVLLFGVYVLFLKNVNKSPLALASCALLLAGLSLLQLEHLGFYLSEEDPLGTKYYRVLIFLVPPMFFIFSRAILFPDARASVWQLLLLAPLPLAFFAPGNVAVPVAFALGTAYCLWITSILYRLRRHRERFRLELFFFGLFTALAVVVLALGFSTSYVDNSYFYHFYTNGIGLAFVLVTGALIAFPDVLQELHEAVRLSYSQSTLGKLDVDRCIDHLETLMERDKLFQNETLNLAGLSETMGLTSHQLSELINTRFGVGFPRYVRSKRVAEAKRLLLEEPEASVLSISLEVGFKSQSNFYTAFREATGQSPGNFRNEHRA